MKYDVICIRTEQGMFAPAGRPMSALIATAAPDVFGALRASGGKG
jgi:hypothetical protein